MKAEIITLVKQFALVVGLWVIAHFAYVRYVRPYAKKFRGGDDARNRCGEPLRYNSYQL